MPCSVDCIGDATHLMIRRRKTFALNVVAFRNWILLNTGDEVYELFHDTRVAVLDKLRRYHAEDSGLYEDLLGALESYGTLGQGGP